jgi:hypothetical protein
MHFYGLGTVVEFQLPGSQSHLSNVWIIQSKIRQPPEAEFLDEIQTKVLRVSPPCYSQSPLQLCLEISTSSNSQNLFQFLDFSYCTYIVKEKGGKPDRKPYPLPYRLRKLYRNLKSENSQDYAQKPQQNCLFMNSASGCIFRCTVRDERRIININFFTSFRFFERSKN